MKIRLRSSEISLAHAAICVFIALPLLAAQPQNASTDAPKQDTHGIIVANMDTSVRPGDDFNRYANGGWIQRTEIPPDRGEVDVFTVLTDLSDKRTVGLIEETAKANAPLDSSGRRIAALYNSFMDEAAIEAKGLAPLRPHLESIAAIQNKDELARALGESLRADVDALNNTNFHTANLFGLWVAPGFNDSEHYAAFLLQGGLQMPDREYYLADNDRMREIRTKYQAHISAMLKLAGFTNTDARAEHIAQLEHAIAEKHLSLADSEDVHKANNTWKQADFLAKAPGLDWAEYFRGAGLSEVASFIVWQPSAFTGSQLSSLPPPWTRGRIGWRST
jgi:endothelin-converting enzyme/putative endopeptidase